jgi:hypothetical protein
MQGVELADWLKVRDFGLLKSAISVIITPYGNPGLRMIKRNVQIDDLTALSDKKWI